MNSNLCLRNTRLRDHVRCRSPHNSTAEVHFLTTTNTLLRLTRFSVALDIFLNLLKSYRKTSIIIKRVEFRVLRLTVDRLNTRSRCRRVQMSRAEYNDVEE